MTFDWDEAKNELLKRVRKVSFEEVVIAIEDGQIVGVLEHPKPQRDPNQRIYLVVMHDYVWVVPFVTDRRRDVIVLKTIYPSRKYTRQYLRKEGHNE